MVIDRVSQLYSQLRMCTHIHIATGIKLYVNIISPHVYHNYNCVAMCIQYV